MMGNASNAQMPRQTVSLLLKLFLKLRSSGRKPFMMMMWAKASLANSYCCMKPERREILACLLIMLNFGVLIMIIMHARLSFLRCWLWQGLCHEYIGKLRDLSTGSRWLLPRRIWTSSEKNKTVLLAGSPVWKRENKWKTCSHLSIQLTIVLKWLGSLIDCSNLLLVMKEMCPGAEGHIFILDYSTLQEVAQLQLKLVTAAEQSGCVAMITSPDDDFHWNNGRKCNPIYSTWFCQWGYQKTTAW